MYAKPEPIIKKSLRVGIVFIVIATIIYSTKYIIAEYSVNAKEQYLIQGGVALVVYALLFLTWFRTLSGLKAKEHHVRGTKLIEYRKALKKAGNLVRSSKSLYFGYLKLPLSVGPSHFAVVGATGSGKTVTLRLLMQSVLPRIGMGGDERALIYDAKGDMLQFLSAICPETKAVTLNPFDKRCVAWDMAKDVTSPATCHQLASALIPNDRRDSQPYFQETAVQLLFGILTVFNKRAKGEWTFRDVMIAIQDIDRVKSIIGSSEETLSILNHWKDEKAIKSVNSTFTTKMKAYEFVAATWDRAEEAVSLRDWINKEYILVLGSHHTIKKALDKINRVIFQRMVELVLSQSETSTRQTWVFLDEVRQAGKLDSLNTLLTKGRSKGACCVLGFQDIEGMRAVYGREVANELVGQCNNKAILKLNSPETAEWASRLFGDCEIYEKRESKNKSATSLWKGSTSVSEQRVRRSVVMPGQFLNLPSPGRENGISGFYIIPEIGSFSKHVSYQELSERLIQPDKGTQDFIERPEDDQTLKPWTREDLMRLGLKDIVELSKKEKEVISASLRKGRRVRKS